MGKANCCMKPSVVLLPYRYSSCCATRSAERCVRREDDDRTELLLEFSCACIDGVGVGLLVRSRREVGRVEHARLERVGKRAGGHLPFPGK